MLLLSQEAHKSIFCIDNIYLSEEGWVYRHFKNTERTLWWDEILVAGQVKPNMTIHTPVPPPQAERPRRAAEFHCHGDPLLQAVSRHDRENDAAERRRALKALYDRHARMMEHDRAGTLLGDHTLLVGVDLGQQEGAVVLLGDLLQHRHEHLAGLTPVRPEVHHHRAVVGFLDQQRRGVGLVDIDYVFAHVNFPRSG